MHVHSSERDKSPQFSFSFERARVPKGQKLRTQKGRTFHPG